MTLRIDIQTRIEQLRVAKQAALEKAKSDFDPKIATLQAFLQSGDELLGKDTEALEQHISEVKQMLR